LTIIVLKFDYYFTYNENITIFNIHKSDNLNCKLLNKAPNKMQL